MQNNNFLKNSIAYIVASFVVKGISFITTPIFTRLMDTADYGIVTNFNTWGMVLSTFLCLKASAGIVSANANIANKRIEFYMGSIIRMSIASAVIIGLAVLVLHALIEPVTALSFKYLPLLVFYSMGSCMSETYSSFCIAANKVKQKVLYSVISSLIIVGISITGVLRCAHKADGRILGSALSYCFIAFFVILYFIRVKPEDKCHFINDIKFSVSFGLPLIPHLLANTVNGNADRVFIIKYLGESEAGIYGVAYSIGVVALIFGNACNDAWTPWYFEKSRNGEKEQITGYFLLYSITISMCFFGSMLLAPEIMSLMAPESYYEGIPCISLVALGIFFMFLYRFPLCYEQLNANTKFAAPATMLAAAANIILNYYFVPVFGIKGAAITTALSYLFLWVFHEFVARKIIKEYEIKFRTYLPAIHICFIGFFLSNAFTDRRVVRILFLMTGCSLYLLYIIVAIKGKKHEHV